MTIQQAIHMEVGEIIRDVQHIEWNLLTRLGIDTHASYSFGEIIGLVRKSHLLGYGQIDQLEEIVRKRNDLVHHYFRRHDFDGKVHDEAYLQSELRYLHGLKVIVANFEHQVDLKKVVDESHCFVTV